MRTLAKISLVILCTLGVVTAVPAQDLLITNATVIDGNGNVTGDRTISVRDGEIVSVSGRARAPDGALEIDARGSIVMPGFIDAHRHVIEGDPDAWLREQASDRMREYLEAGFTTVLSAGDAVEQIVELRSRLANGEITGPRLIVSGMVPLVGAPPQGFAPGIDPARGFVMLPPGLPLDPAPAIPEAQTRETVRSLAQAGVDTIKTVMNVEPSAAERDTLAVIADEAERQGIVSITHAVSVQSTVDAINAGTDYLVHAPVFGQVNEETTQKIATAGIPMTATLGVFLPTFANRNAHVRERTGDDDVARFRDLDPFPTRALARTSHALSNTRLLWEAGITLAFGTDTSFLPRDALRHELNALQVVFSNTDIVEMLTKNAATAVGLSDTVGALEAGKTADIVILNGDPLGDIFELLDVAVVIKSGEIVVDRR